MFLICLLKFNFTVGVVQQNRTQQQRKKWRNRACHCCFVLLSVLLCLCSHSTHIRCVKHRLFTTPHNTKHQLTRNNTQATNKHSNTTNNKQHTTQHTKQQHNAHNYYKPQTNTQTTKHTTTQQQQTNRFVLHLFRTACVCRGTPTHRSHKRPLCCLVATKQNSIDLLRFCVVCLLVFVVCLFVCVLVCCLLVGLRVVCLFAWLFVCLLSACLLCLHVCLCCLLMYGVCVCV